jgi:hypothetical protein
LHQYRSTSSCNAVNADNKRQENGPERPYDKLQQFVGINKWFDITAPVLSVRAAFEKEFQWQRSVLAPFVHEGTVPNIQHLS